MKFALFFLLLTCMCAAVECNCIEVICEHREKTINCSPGGEIKIIDAFYGRKEKDLCVEDSKTQICAATDSFQIISGHCDGKQSCSIKASNDVFGDPCGGVYKYAKVEYICNYDPSSKPTLLSANATNSTCINVKWTHIPNTKVIGYLQGYEMQYYKSNDKNKRYKNVNTGVVTEHEICNLNYFTDYIFQLGAKNGTYYCTDYDEISGKSGEYIPRKYTKNVTATDTGTYSVRVSWKELTEVDNWRGYPFKYYVYYKLIGETNYTEMSVNSSIFEVDIDNLKSYIDYEVAVAAATVVGIGQHSDAIVVKTGEDVPIGPPQSLSGDFIDSRSIKVNWSEVASEERKGVITQYLVICMSMESDEMGRQNVSANSKLTAVFGDLDTYTLYNVTVAAYTKIGLGPASSAVTVRTWAGRPLLPPANVSGYNTSSTSIYLSWEDISEEAWAGVIGDFKLVIQSLKEPQKKTTKDIMRANFTGKQFSYKATDLAYFTQYKISIACFNSKGVSNFTQIVVTTEEEVAVMPPPNIRVIAHKSNQIEVSWDLPLGEYVPGIIRTYTIRLQAIYEAEDLTIGLGSTPSRRRRDSSCLICCEGQYCDGLDFSMHNITVHGTNSTSFNTTGLRGDTLYNISVSVNTKFAGLIGLPIQIVTPQGTPSMSAYNFTCKGVSHSSLLLQWKHSPPAFLEGIRTKYMIYYQLRKVVTEIDEPYKRNIELFFLKPGTTYTVWITAFTNAGEGETTTKINCSTLETFPKAYPLNLTATSYHYPHSSLIRWNHLEDDQWLGFKLGYTIFYSKLSTGEIGVDEPITDNFAEVGYTTSHVLTGLDVYSSYRVRITARTNVGVGITSDYVIMHTCRIPQAKLILNYMVYPPYVDNPKRNNLRPEGILMHLTEQMLMTCAHNCTSFNQSVYISYNRVDLDSFSDINNFTVNGTGLQMPRMDTGKYTYGYSHIAIVTTPGFVLLEVPDDAVEAATKVELKLFRGILGTLPLCGLFFLLNFLFGVLFWICEPTKVEHKGRGISIRGLFEGLYLTVMTSTTVGYGDKVPQTKRGRMYIVIWTLIGLVLTGIVAGSLSSVLSVSVIFSLSQNLPEDKILALYGTSEYAYGKKNAKDFDTHKPYRSYEEVLSPLNQQSIKYALLDRYVAETLKLNTSAYGLSVKKAFNVPTDFGVAAFGEMEKLKVCGRKFATDNTYISDAAIEELFKKYSAVKTLKPSGNKPIIDIISWRANMYQYIIKILLVLLLAFILFGLIYEVFRRRRRKNRRRKIYTTLELKEQLHKELKVLAQNTIQEFRDMIKRVDNLIEKLNYKHGKELLKMRTEMSKKLGVNLKYVKPSELGLPLEKILEYKEELKNKPNKSFFVKVRRFKGLVFGQLGRIFPFFRRN